MKKVILLIFIISLISCNKKTEVEKVTLNYLKSKRTGICYSIIIYRNTGPNSGEVWNKDSMCCIPCDSLKNIDPILIDY